MAKNEQTQEDKQVEELKARRHAKLDNAGILQMSAAGDKPKKVEIVSVFGGYTTVHADDSFRAMLQTTLRVPFACGRKTIPWGMCCGI